MDTAPQPKPCPSGVHWRLAGTCFVLYAFYVHFGLQSDNEQIRYALAKAIVEDGSFQVDRFRPFLGLDKAVFGGHIYCDKPPGASFLIVPQVLVAKLLVRPSVFSDWTEMVRAWLVICLSVCVYAAASVALLYDVLGRLGVERGRVWYCYAYGAGTLAFPYATVLVGAQFAAPLVIACVWCALRGERRRHLVGLGALVGLTFVTYYHAILIVGWLIPLKWLQLESKRRIGWALAPALAFLLLLMGYNWACFGGPLSMSYSRWQGGRVHLRLSLPTLEQVYWATFSSWKGMFCYSPWLLFGFGGLVALWRERRLWGAYTTLGAVCYIGFLLLNNQPDGHYWWGGADFGARAFVPVLPVLAMAAAVGAEKGIGALFMFQWKLCRSFFLRVTLVCTIAFSIFACSLGALTSPMQYELTRARDVYYVIRQPHEPKQRLDDVTNPLFDTTFRALMAFGSNNFITQLWPPAYVRAKPTLGQWALNMATNVVPLLVIALVWLRRG